MTQIAPIADRSWTRSAGEPGDAILLDTAFHTAADEAPANVVPFAPFAFAPFAPVRVFRDQVSDRVFYAHGIMQPTRRNSEA